LGEADGHADSEHALAGELTRRFRGRYTEIIRDLVDSARAEHGRAADNGLVSSKTVAEIIEAWVQATRLRPGTLRTRHRYVNEAVRFFAEQAAPEDQGPRPA
jgi:hypothetical protein